MELHGTGLIAIARSVSKWIGGGIKKLFFQRAYSLSTLYFNHRQMISRAPRKLGSHLLYDIYWDEYMLGERQRSPKISIRSATGQHFSKAVISVSACNQKVNYQSLVTLYDLDERRHYGALESVPFRRLKFDGNMVYTPYDRFRICLIELADKQGRSMLPTCKVEDQFSPMDRLEIALGQQQGFIEQWDRVYHLGLIEREITEVLVRLSRYRISRSPVRRAFSRVLAHRSVAKTLFWRRNAFSAKPLEELVIAYLEEYTESMTQKEVAQT